MMKKVLVRILVVVLILAATVGVYVLIDYLNGPKSVELKEGWQLVQLDGIVPQGATVIVDEDSNAVLPSENTETKRANAFVSQGRVNFLDSGWMITKKPVWVYFPSEYEFILDKGEFNKECQEKLSNLTGENIPNFKEFDFGKP